SPRQRSADGQRRSARRRSFDSLGRTASASESDSRCRSRTIRGYVAREASRPATARPADAPLLTLEHARFTQQSAQPRPGAHGSIERRHERLPTSGRENEMSFLRQDLLGALLGALEDELGYGHAAAERCGFEEPLLAVSRPQVEARGALGSCGGL